MKTFTAGDFDAIVVGAGHAGMEAALALARLSYSTLMLTISLDGIALMACNPSIGGSSKGHLVREIDALGGEMGLGADACSMQQKLLNTSKGPAVRSLRSQQDKRAYQRYMKNVAESTDNLSVAQGECVRVLTKGGAVCGIETALGEIYTCRALVLATGVYLKGRVIIGQYSVMSGPSGLAGANSLTQSLEELGLTMMRFKTGTPARVDARSLDYTKMSREEGMENAPPFSFMHDTLPCPQVPCYLTYTNTHTHDIIRANLDRSPLYTGTIKGVGPRYCPSIEDKVVRFADKSAHQVFIEPEGMGTKEMYVQGMSSSLPADVQAEMLHTLAGLENCRIMRYGYAIEYDLIDPIQLKSTLEVKSVGGLFTAGQINGSSGYEEAAGQGIIAGINAARYLGGEEGLVLSRTDGYIGVLIDDLVTKGTVEPYRMMTSRAEHRLILRQDNADLRLTQIGRDVGLVSDARYSRLMRKREEIAALTKAFAAPVAYEGVTMRMNELLKRPGIDSNTAQSLCALPPHSAGALEEAVTEIKYAGYIEREQREAARQKRLENLKLRADIDYAAISALRREAAQKLSRVQPTSIAQAAFISGVSPADISVLLVYLEKHRQKEDIDNEQGT